MQSSQWFKCLSVSTRISTFLILGASILAFSVSPVKAQSSIAGTVAGQVKDESGAAVPGVAVKIVELSTGTSFSTVSNDTGRYDFPTVPPGKYDVNFTKAGFSEFSIKGQDVKIGVVLTANGTLRVGSTSTTIEVSASAGAELQTMNATVGNTMNQTSLIVLPNLGRDATTMALMQPATSPGGQAAGAVGDLNTYQLDGANISDDMAGNVTSYINNMVGLGGSQGNSASSGVIPTPVESIEEFKVSVSNQTSDFNNSSGSQVQMTTKRGTNQFHGSAYMFYFDNAIGEANSWSNNHTPYSVGSLSYPDTPVDYPKNHRSRFGGAVGGPLLPKPFLGGKWFFFANYEGLRIPNANVYSTTVPTVAMREGIVQIPNAAGTYIPYNLTNQTINFGGTPLAPTQCANGPCDPRQLGVNPIVSQIWGKQIPLPNNPASGDDYNTEGFLSTIRTPLTTNNYVGRIDHDFTEKEHFYLTYRDYKYVSLTNSQVDIGGVIGNDQFGVPTALAPRPQQPSVWTAGLTSTLTPTTTNTFVFSYLRNFWQWSDSGGPAQGFGLGGALEIGGEAKTGYIPYNVDSQDIRQRFWDGQDKTIRDDMTILKGNHLITFGGAYGRNFDYHSRSDNGAGVNNSISYLSTSSGINFTGYVPGAVPASGMSNYESYYSYITGMVSSTQVMYTRALPSLSPLPVGTPATDQSIIPYYSIYWQDSWHMKPSFTLTYGMGWNLEMPPYELQGKQVALVDDSGQPINTASFLNQRLQAQLQGGNYTPEVGYELVRNVGTGLKYPYNPYYGEFSPRASFAWNPHYSSDGMLGKLFGSGKTVIRGGYSRIFGRLNGVDLVLVPLLGPGLLQGVTCVNPLMSGTCNGGSAATPANAFRIGTDGLSAPLPTASATLPQPFFPGGTNPESPDASSLDPNLRPDRTDNFTLTLQREINSHVSLEVGYIGKIMKNEFQSINLDSVPIYETMGGQSFASAYAQVYEQMVFQGVAPQSITAQPFFEAALGGANSSFCKGFASCTQAMLTASGWTGNQTYIKNTQVSDFYAKLVTASSWALGRTTYSQPFNGGNPQDTSLLMETSLGHANYNALFATFRTNAWHGITTASNFTWGRVLGTSAIVQASSETAALNPYNLNAEYGPISYDYKFLYNMNMYYETPWYKGQHGVIGHILGGWTLSPIFIAQSGSPTGVTYAEGSSCTGCEAFGENTDPSGSTASPNSNTSAEHAVGFMPYTGNIGGHYGVLGGTGNNIAFGAASVGTATHSGTNYGLNFYANPAAVYSEFRPCVLGFDTSCGGPNGPIRGLPTWNLDAQVVKNVGIFRERIGAQVFFTVTNVLNHFQPSSSAGSLTSATSFGQITGQSNSPRSMEFGLRIHF